MASRAAQADLPTACRLLQQWWCRWPRAVAAAAAMACAASAAGIATAEPGQRPAAPSRLAGRSLMLDIAACGTRLVAVGERGRVLLSDDRGASWRQARSVPASATLTAVQCADATRGWAVGHAGVVLRTDDGGDSWVLQLDGTAAARLALDAVKSLPAEAAARRQAELLVSDGPDKPFLALRFSNPMQGLIVGAYGLIFSTDDGGATWQSRMQDTDNPQGLHLNAVRTIGTQTWLAGEKGLLLRSDDGKRFAALKSPYDGSWFTIDAAPGGGVVVAGLRGNVWFSADDAASWRKLALPRPATVVASRPLRNQQLLLLAQDGAGYALGASGTTSALPLPPMAPPTAAIQTDDAALVVATFRGPVRVAPGAPPASPERAER